MKDWASIGNGECDADDEKLIDVRFSSGRVLTRYYPWEIKWHGDNPGFGFVTGYREHEVARSIHEVDRDVDKYVIPKSPGSSRGWPLVTARPAGCPLPPGGPITQERS